MEQEQVEDEIKKIRDELIGKISKTYKGHLTDDESKEVVDLMGVMFALYGKAITLMSFDGLRDSYDCFVKVVDILAKAKVKMTIGGLLTKS